MTSIARYSLMLMRPDAERMDTLCVGALVLTEGGWQVMTPGAGKLEQLGYTKAARRLMAMNTNLQHHLEGCASLADARAMLAKMRSTLAVHEFEGAFAYDSDHDFQRHLSAIVQESIAAPPPAEDDAVIKPARAPRTRVSSRLRRHFADMGILAARGDTNADHQVVPNYPISKKHGLRAEFALKNSVWHITETVDFEVSTDSVRNKTYEAQAKCLVMHTAKEVLGANTRRYIVIHGGNAAHAANTVDLLSTVGDLFMSESNEDMTTYLDLIAQAAGSTRQMNAQH